LYLPRYYRCLNNSTQVIGARAICKQSQGNELSQYSFPYRFGGVLAVIQPAWALALFSQLSVSHAVSVRVCCHVKAQIMLRDVYLHSASRRCETARSCRKHTNGHKFPINSVKGKAVPLQAWSGPEGSRNLWFPDFMTTAQDGGKVVSLTHRPPLLPRNITGTHFC